MRNLLQGFAALRNVEAFQLMSRDTRSGTNAPHKHQQHERYPPDHSRVPVNPPNAVGPEDVESS